MLLKFETGEYLDEKYHKQPGSVSINPTYVASVERLARCPGYVVVTMKDRREHHVLGDVDSVSQRINAACLDKE